jgi:hypothetical protein
MTLRYTNHSPDTLKVFWFQTEQRSEVIDRFDQVVDGTPVALTYEHPEGDVFETTVTPARPVAPGQTTVFQIQWHFVVPEQGGRMGRVGPLYEMAQWYPRPNVYDDVKGWNTESYATDAEFYLEFGTFDVNLTLPAAYVVAATGVLTNPADVLTPVQTQRLAHARSSSTPVAIITVEELQSGAARPKKDGMLTWKFHADSVRDFVWAATPEFLWDAAGWHGILAQSYYRPRAIPAWGHGLVADMARTSIQEYSERWWRYPYPQVSVVEGPLTGDEYPMLSFDGDLSGYPPQALSINGGGGRSSSETLLYSIITHEVGHNWFPMVVGSNERTHTWQDEGFDTFINTFSEARRYPRDGTPDERVRHLVFRGKGTALETGKIVGNAVDQYAKTAYIMQLLRRDVLGPAMFDRAFRTYIQRWAFKHPTPVDFFRTMADVSKRNLDWFWREGFLEAPRFDQAIDSVTQVVHGNETRVTVTYGNRARMVLPLLVRFTFSDATTQDVTYPAEIWRDDAVHYIATYTFHHKTVRHIAVDPDTHLPDADRANNDWTAP